MREKNGNNTIELLKEYLYRTRWAIVLAGVIAFMAHGSVLFSQRFGFDTDAIMNGMHNFDQIGRYGLVWLAQFLGLSWFNLYYAQVLALLFSLCLCWRWQETLAFRSITVIAFTTRMSGFFSMRHRYCKRYIWTVRKPEP